MQRYITRMSLPKSGMLPDAHRVPDVLAPGLTLVFCGTALGRRSAERKAYYANPSNLFWRTLYETGMTPRRFAPEEYSEVTALGIGLTDLCKNAFGNDAELHTGALDRAALEEKLKQFQPRILAFTSKKAASIYLETNTGKLQYGLQPQRGNTQVFVLPSPSGSGRRYWDAAPWHALAAIYKQLR